MADERLGQATARQVGRWWPVVVGIVLVLFGLPIAAGGAWLILVGGSWYYLPAGIGLLVTAYFLFKRDSFAFWVYLVTFLATLAFALWEAGLNGWAQVPRLVAPTLVLLLILTTLPMLRGQVMRVRPGMVAAVVTLFGLVGAMTVGSHGMGRIVAQESTLAPGVQPPAIEFSSIEGQSSNAAVPSSTATEKNYVALGTRRDWFAYGGTHLAPSWTP